jgi:hypothetical protein
VVAEHKARNIAIELVFINPLLISSTAHNRDVIEIEFLIPEYFITSDYGQPLTVENI